MWYQVGHGTKNDLAPHGSGSETDPYNALQLVQGNSAPGDRISVLHSPTPLDGGILLQDGQELAGVAGPNGELPVITNSDLSSNGGVGLTLAFDNRIEGMEIRDTQTQGIHGLNPGHVEIAGVKVYAFNLSGPTIDLQDSEFAVFGVRDMPGIQILMTGTSESTIVLKNNIVGDPRAAPS